MIDRGAYSGTQTPLQGQGKSPAGRLFCEDHPGEKITNFCFASLKPLCPACIDFHNKMMKQNGTFPEVDTLKNVKVNCAKKVKSAIMALTGELQKLDSQLVINPKEIIDEGVVALRRTRDKLIDHINKYFEELEINYAKKINEAILKAMGYNDVNDKIKNLLNELEHLLYNIETPNCIPTVKKICLIDLKTLLDKFRADVNQTLHYRNTVTNNFSELRIDESRIVKIEEEISKYAYLLHKDERATGGLTDRFRESGLSYEDPKSSLTQFHKIYHNDTSLKYTINLPDYFEPGCKRQYLHFFQNHENRLHYIDLEQLINSSRASFNIIELKNSFTIPPFHKSIAVPNGDIYLVGGSDVRNSSKKLSSTYVLDLDHEDLIPKAQMNVPRSSFAICYMNRFIYAIGGLTNNSNFTPTCERYDIVANKWSLIANLNHDVLAPCVTPYNNKYLFKFGGNSPENKLETFIERYDPAKNTWTPCNVRIELPEGMKPSHFKILNTSACIQINSQDIYIFGGYLEDNSSSNQTFLFKVVDEYDEQYVITGVGAKTLTHPEAFWNNIPVVKNKCIFALQNVQTVDQEDVCLDDKRRLIVFNSVEWKSLN